MFCSYMSLDCECEVLKQVASAVLIQSWTYLRDEQLSEYSYGYEYYRVRYLKDENKIFGIEFGIEFGISLIQFGIQFESVGISESRWNEFESTLEHRIKTQFGGGVSLCVFK